MESGYVGNKTQRKQVVPVKRQLEVSIASQLQQVRTNILNFNKKGDLHGLFSCHVLSDSPDFTGEWCVACNDRDWVQKVFDRSNLYHIASLGYSMSMTRTPCPELESVFANSLQSIQKRKYFNGTHVSLPYQPVTFLGLVLGVKHLGDKKESNKYLSWLSSVLAERRKRGKISELDDLFYRYIGSQLEGKIAAIMDVNRFSSLEELSFIEWGCRRGHFQVNMAADRLYEVRERVLQLLVEANITQIAPEHLALIWSAAHNSVCGGVKGLVESPNQIGVLLRRFPDAMKRWRYDENAVREPIKWPVRNEEEVQDIVWLMLRPYYDDLVDEEHLPKFGHSSYKPDFAIPSLRTLLEVKYVRARAEFKKIEKEIMQDSVGYLTNTEGYDKIVVFMYDHSCSSQEHDETRRALMKIRAIEEVVIVCRPSQLPA